MKIVLIGYMYSGKTSVGKRISNMLGFEFKDTDTIIEKSCGKSVNDIFNMEGEEFFRQKERETLLDLLEEDNIVISTGGGLPCYKDNMQLIKENCKSIYLQLSPAQILSRAMVSKRKRPLLENLSAEEKLRYIETSLMEREPYYRQADVYIGALSISRFELEITLEHLVRGE